MSRHHPPILPTCWAGQSEAQQGQRLGQGAGDPGVRLCAQLPARVPPGWQVGRSQCYQTQAGRGDPGSLGRSGWSQGLVCWPRFAFCRFKGLLKSEEERWDRGGRVPGGAVSAARPPAPWSRAVGRGTLDVEGLCVGEEAVPRLPQPPLLGAPRLPIRTHWSLSHCPAGETPAFLTEPQTSPHRPGRPSELMAREAGPCLGVQRPQAPHTSPGWGLGAPRSEDAAASRSLPGGSSPGPRPREPPAGGRADSEGSCPQVL